MKQEYIKTKKLIKKCFNINFSIPKGYGTRGSDYEKWYDMKEKLIKKIVENIKIFVLPIKYGINYDEYCNKIIYFEFEGEQFSFHRPYVNCKKFKGEWTGIRRENYERNKNNKIIGKKSIY